MFSGEFCEHLSNKHLFYRTCPVATSVKACNFTKIRLRQISRCRWLFRKNKNTINCDDNDSIFSDTRAFAFTRQSMKRNFAWSTRAIHLLSSLAFLSRLKFWFAKILKMKLRIAPTETNFCKLSRPCKNSRYFQKMVQLFNLTRIMLLARLTNIAEKSRQTTIRDYFPVRDY